jgi:hypothetical protein
VGVSIQTDPLLGGARPVGTPMPCRKGRMAHSFSFWRPGESQHPRLSALLPWECTPRAEAFPDASVHAAALPKTVQPEVSCLRSSTAPRTMVEHGRVFTYGPSPHNPYTIRLFKYCSPLLFARSKNGKIRAKAEDALPLPLKRLSLRRAQALFCQMMIDKAL